MKLGILLSVRLLTAVHIVTPSRLPVIIVDATIAAVAWISASPASATIPTSILGTRAIGWGVWRGLLLSLCLVSIGSSRNHLCEVLVRLPRTRLQLCALGRVAAHLGDEPPDAASAGVQIRDDIFLHPGRDALVPVQPVVCAQNLSALFLS